MCGCPLRSTPSICRSCAPRSQSCCSSGWPAGDVFESGAGVDRLLFGTLVGLDGGDLAVSAGAAALAAVGSMAFGRAWLASGFDPAGTRAIGTPADLADGLLLTLVALAVVAALPAVGALLVTAILIVPAATARLMAGTLRGLVARA